MSLQDSVTPSPREKTCEGKSLQEVQTAVMSLQLPNMAVSDTVSLSPGHKTTNVIIHQISEHIGSNGNKTEELARPESHMLPPSPCTLMMVLADVHTDAVAKPSPSLPSANANLPLQPTDSICCLVFCYNLLLLLDAKCYHHFC